MNNKIELYFPTKDREGSPIDHTRLWIDTLRNVYNVMVNLFSGCTTTKATGHWRSQVTGKVIWEDILIIFSHCDNQQLNAYRGHMNNLARKVCLDLRQDTVALVINGEMNFVS